MKTILPSLAILLLVMAGCTSGGAQTQVAGASVEASPAIVASSLPPVPEQQISVAGFINGLYRGQMTLVQDTSPPCPDSARGSLEIGDRKLYFAYAPDVIFVAPISGDGKVHAAVGGYVLDGTMVAGDLDVSVTGPSPTSCRSDLMFRRLDAF
jgi:hypothetical protein